MRLASFLTRVEHAFEAGAAGPQDGPWVSSRTINYHLRLARLLVGTRRDQARGSIVLQSFTLADGSACVRASLYWSESTGEPGSVHSIYPRNDTDWEAEAAHVAKAWLAGSVSSRAEALSAAAEPLAAAV